MYFFVKHFSPILLLFFCLKLVGQEKKYFQQEANFSISAQLDVKKKLLQGECSINYHNHSNDTLYYLWFHLWANAYSDPYKTAFGKQFLNLGKTNFVFSNEKEKGGYKQLSFFDQNTELKFENSENPDVAKVNLEQPLPPGKSIQLRIPFTLKLPKNISRMGYDENGSFHFCQWLPKPAVYDSKGWHPMPYLEMGEYYSEFGSFKVTLTLPKDYLVAATGTLMNRTESDSLQTLTFQAEKVHDFAWFLDKRFIKKMGKCTLQSGKIVDLEAFFPTNDSMKWKEVIRYMSQAVSYFSNQVGEYPYPKVAVVGSDLKVAGGMEYPMITIVRSNLDTASLNTVIAHEIAHNWFYGVLASNERDFPFLDEGFTKYLEDKYTLHFQNPSNSVFPKFFLKNESFADQKNLWNSLFSSSIHDMKKGDLDQSSVSYLLEAYSNMALALHLLEARQGEEKMKAALHQLWNDWTFKHPYPSDFQKSMEKALGGSLDWLFRDYLQEYKTSDYRIGKVYTKGNTAEIELVNNGKLASPLPLWHGNKATSQQLTWVDGFLGKKVIQLPTSQAKALNLDKQGILLEDNLFHHTYRQRPLFKKVKPITFSLLNVVGTPYTHNINLTPVLNYNTSDGILPGLAIWNTPLPFPNLQYYAIPFYSFKTKQLNGEAALSKYWYNIGGIHQIELSANYRTFHYNSNAHYDFDDRYHRYMALADFRFFRKESGWQPSLRWQTTFIQQNYGQGIKYDEKIFDWKNRSYYINALSFTLNKKDALLPLDLTTTLEQGEGFAKAYLNYRQEIKYARKRKGSLNGTIRINAFAGTFLYTGDNMKAAASFRLNGTTGFEIFQKDYTFSNSLFARNAQSGFWSQQIFRQDAQLHTLATIGTNRQYLVGLSLSDGLPLPIPVRWYADAAVFPDAFTTKAAFAATVGLNVSLIKDVLEVNFPIWNSQNIKENLSLYRTNYWQTVSFLMDFKVVNPFGMLRNL